MDDKTLDEMCKDVGFNNSLRERRSPSLTADSTEHCNTEEEDNLTAAGAPELDGEQD